MRYRPSVLRCGTGGHYRTICRLFNLPRGCTNDTAEYKGVPRLAHAGCRVRCRQFIFAAAEMPQRQQTDRFAEPWLLELSGLSGTIGPLSGHYRATIGPLSIGSDSGSGAIGAIGHYRGTIGPFQIGTTIAHYRGILSVTIGLSASGVLLACRARRMVRRGMLSGMGGEPVSRERGDQRAAGVMPEYRVACYMYATDARVIL